MTNRRAFTLLELIVSIVVAGIIALLAYASASAGFDTRDALERYRTTAEAELRARSLITDAFRHASDEGDAGVPALELLDGMDPGGLPADQLTFLTRGVLPPLGASTLWSVMLTPSAKGLSLRAAPVGSSTGAVTARLPNVRGLDVQVMALADQAWSSSWPASRQLPAAVRLTLYDASGSTIGSPIVVRLGLESAR